jgi:predicted ATPase
MRKEERRLDMKKIVLTGGPCSGKTTVLQALKEEFYDQIMIVPEVATILLEGGFPIPGKHLEWSEDWQAAFQSAILPLQKSMEDAYAIMAADNSCELIVCDRGVLDGAAYTPGGVDEFCKRYGVDAIELQNRYTAVIHLESLATADPEKYGKTGNESRFEPIERAQELEKATRSVWGAHTRHLVIGGRRGIDGKINEVIEVVKLLLAER